MNSSVILVSALDAEGEHFFLMLPPDVGDLARAMANVPKFASGAELKAWAKDRWQQYLHALPSLTEADARRELAQHGFAVHEVEEKIAKARRAREWAPQHDLEFLTQPGYRNLHGQLVVRKTANFDATSFQRIYVLRCGSCQGEHGVKGCDIHVARCPDCQGSGIGNQDSGLI